MGGTGGHSLRIHSTLSLLLHSISLFLAFAIVGGGQTPLLNPPVLNENIKVWHCEPMAYPLDAKVRHIEGAVVLQARVDAMGQVSNAMALSGPKALLKESLENLQKWQFAEGRQTAVVVVYWFRFSGICEMPCPSGFEFHPPNLVVITAGTPVFTE